MSSHITETPPLDFRKPEGNRTRAGGFVVLTGLGLIALGGCFLIGVMETLRFAVVMQSREGVIGMHVELFIAILYVLSFTCMAGGALSLLMGIRGLVRVMQDRSSES